MARWHTLGALLLLRSKCVYPLSLSPRSAALSNMKSIIDANTVDSTTIPAAALLLQNKNDSNLSNDDNQSQTRKLQYASELVPQQEMTLSEYQTFTTNRHADCRELFDGYTTQLLRCEALTDGSTLNIRWRCEWIPASSNWLYQLANVAKWNIHRVEPDPSRLSTFSWTAVRKLFATAFHTGTVSLPISAVEGSTLVTVRDDTILLRETIDLVREADRNRLQNRRVAQELSSWLDVSRRPPSRTNGNKNDNDWSRIVSERILPNVPGAGFLDVDPMEDETEGLTSVFVFGVVIAVTLTFFPYILEEVIGYGNTKTVVSELCNDATRVDFGSGYLSECFGPYGDGPFL